MKTLFSFIIVLLFTLYSYAQQANKANEIRESVKRGDDVNFANALGKTMLMEASMLGDEKLIDLLLKNKASIDKVDTAGSSALLFAAASGSINCVDLLLKAGANPYLYDHKLKTVLDYAKQNGNAKLIAKLSEIIKPLKWYTFEEAIELSKKNPKKIFIDVYTEWCGWCKVMDNNTFSHPYIAKILMDNYYPVKFDAEQKAELKFNNKVYINPTPEVKRSTHEFAVYLLNGKLGYPTVVVLDEKGSILQAAPGYKKPNEMELLLMYFASDKFKDIDWNVFQKQFKSGLN
ncbi:MAG: ankyrin repeat domain-containing protein [Bacteroidota bacterium]